MEMGAETLDAAASPDEDWVIYEKQDRTAYITLNRPDKLNALPATAYEDLGVLFRRAEDDDAIKVVVLRGKGRAFCAGMDLRNAAAIQGLKTPKPGERAERPPQRHALIRKERADQDLLRYCFKTTIAQVHGHCFGAGMALALGCDYVVAAEGTRFEDPDMKFGAAGVTANLFQILLAAGPKKARELTMFGRRFTAEEGERLGLVNRVVPLEGLEAATADYVQAVCALPADGLALSKAYFLAVLDLIGYATAHRIAHVTHGQTLHTRFGDDEFNFLRAQRNLGMARALAALRERFPAGW